MSETAKILERARVKLGLTSHYKLALALGWSHGTVSNYRRGLRAMDVEQVSDFASKTGIPVEEVLAAAVMDKKSSKRGKKIQGTLNLQVSA